MKKFAVFGNPIKQSISPVIHQAFAKQADIEINYSKQLSYESDIKKDIADFLLDSRAMGCNITAPFKEAAFELADVAHESASIAGAANTLHKVNNKIEAHNTDGDGLVYDLNRLLGNLKDKNVLLLGAGGAARGVICPLIAQNIKNLTIANRTVEKAEALAKTTAGGYAKACSLSELSGCYDIVINCTSASLSGHVPELGKLNLSASELAYDMSYGAKPTAFLIYAKSQGSKTCEDGLGMLVGQAAMAFTIWTGFAPSLSPLLSQLRQDMFV